MGEAGPFGELLRTYRQAAGFTQQELADRAGLSARAVSDLERGVKAHPHRHTVAQLIGALALASDARASLEAALRQQRRDAPPAPGSLLHVRPALQLLGAAPAASQPPALPAPLSSFVGRAREVAALRQVLEGTHLLTLTGPGGCGKTRLALEVARGLTEPYAGRVWLVELAPLGDAALLLPAVAASVGSVESAGTALEAALVAALSPRATLLVLDNCEHLIDGCAALASMLLARCPRLRILATSRERLRLDGEVAWPVPPLALPDADGEPPLDALRGADAVRLFVERAQAVRPGLALTPETAAAVSQICRRLDGLPLAIELAAARTPVLTAEQILERLDEPFRLLTGGARAAPSRQQTLAATLDWSYILLGEAERALFRRLSVFPGEFALADVEAVATPDELDRWAMLDAMTGLVDKSLLMADHAAQPAARYRLLEPIRQYAAAHLAAAAEAAEIHARHATYYLDLAERAGAALQGPDQEQWLACLDREQGNLRAALQWALEHRWADGGLRAAAALVPYWETRGYLSEGRRWLEAMLTSAASAPSALRVRALTGAGHLAYLQGEHATAEGLLRDGLAVGGRAGDPADVAAPLTELGMVLRMRGDLAESERCLREGLACSRASDDRAGVAFALLHLGATAARRDEVARAMALFEESLTIWETLGDRRRVVFIWSILGIYAIQLGDSDTAVGYLTRSLAEHRRLGDRWKLLNDLLGLAWVLLARGKSDDAARLLGAAEARGEGPGDPVPRIDSGTFRSLLEAVRPHRQEPAFAAAWAEGRAMALDAAVDYALAAVVTPAAAGELPAQSGEREPLTRREHEVARLLAQGWSDRQIADALSISVSTVGVHVHHILAKLGLRSRWQVGAAVSAGALPGSVTE